MTDVKTIYSTNDGMADGVTVAERNPHSCAIAIGFLADEGTYAISVMGRVGDTYAIVDRSELRLIYEALRREFDH